VVQRFLARTLRYWLSQERYRSVDAEYRREGRSIHGQELELDLPRKRALLHRLRTLSRPEHRHYRYHHFEANCSTKVRDVLDEVLGGALRRQWQRMPALTYRHWLRQATLAGAGFFLGFDLILSRADRPVTAWEAAFLPERLRWALDRTQVRGPAGAAFPLVRRTRMLRAGDPRFERAGAGSPWAWTVGGAWALLLLLGGVAVGFQGRAPARAAAAMLAIAWGLVAGLSGVLLAGVAIVTRIDAFTGSWNLLLLPPTHLLLAAWGVAVARRGLAPGRLTRAVRGYVAAAAVLVLVVLAGRLLGFVDQDNTAVLAIALPWSASCLVLAHLAGRSRAFSA
jgi:hypothetical protein